MDDGSWLSIAIIIALLFCAMKFGSDELYLKSEEEMRALFPDYPEAYDNTVKIAGLCNFDFEFGHYHLPVFQLPEEETDSFSYLQRLCYEGLAKRFPDGGPELKKQLDYELRVIRNMGFVDYFLIVWDFVHFAKSQGIPVGPGRGSAAGSMVSYCLFITDVNPVKYSLFFERFLNPERVTMPDIDMPVDKVRDILKIAQEPVSLETPIGEEEDSHLGDFIEDEGASEPSEAASFTLLKEQLMTVLDTLTSREKKVLELRFGILDGRTRTLEEVGKEFNVTRERIRQIEAKALRKLRHPSRSKKLRDFLS